MLVQHSLNLIFYNITFFEQANTNICIVKYPECVYSVNFIGLTFVYSTY